MQVTAEAFAEVPADYAYAQATGFDRLEKLARDADLTVEPLDRPELGDGPSWYVTGKAGAMHLDLLVTIAEQVPGERLTAIIVFKNIWFDTVLHVDDMGPGRCRMRVNCTGKAKGLKARFLLKGLSMADGKLSSQTAKALRKAAKRMEAEYGG